MRTSLRCRHAGIGLTLALAVALGGAGCVVGNSSPCSDSKACPSPLVCVDNVCVARGGLDSGLPVSTPDAALRDGGAVESSDAGRADAASPASLDASAVPDASAVSTDAGDLVAWYAMEPGDIASGVVTDRSGSGHDAVVHGAPRSAAGHAGGALQFDGVADYLETGYQAGLAQWTVATWVKADAEPGSAKDTGPVMKENNFLMSWDHRDAAFRGAAGIGVGGNWYAASFGTVHAGTWYHLAATYDGTALRAYRDGVLAATTAVSGVPDDCGCSMKVARGAIDAEFFAGIVDEVRVYSRALTGGEIAALAGGTATTCTPDPCNGHGACDASSGSPVCTCSSHFSGPTCSSCAGPYTGATCAQCAPGYHEEPAGSGTCVADGTGDTYHIDPGGSDTSGDGSSGAPWKSLAHACAQVTAQGDVIHVNAGTYLETAQCELAVGVSIEGEGVASVINSQVTGSVYSYAFTIVLESSSTVDGHQHISNIKMDGGVGGTPTAYGAIYVYQRGNVEIRDCVFVDFFFYGVGFQGGNGSSGGYVVPPVTYPTGNKIHDCIITNCSAYYLPNEKVTGEGKGAIIVDGQQDMEINNNTLTQTSRAPGYNGYLIKGVTGQNKGLKIHHNTIVKAPYEGTTWDFAIELWCCRGGVEIYDNDITGSIDISGSGGELTASTHKTGSYAYGVYIHDNYIHQVNSDVFEGVRGILIEQSAEDVIIEKNRIENVTTGIYCPLGYAGSTFKNIDIRYNILANIGGPDWQAWGISVSDDPTGYTCDNVNVYNNVISARVSGNTTVYGVNVPAIGTTTNVHIVNNIIKGFDQEPVHSGGGTGKTIDYLTIRNNVFYQNGNGDEPSFSGTTPSHYTTTPSIKSDPLFVSSSDFHLQSGSPAINAGMDVGLTSDYSGNPIVGNPDIGAYEYQ